MARTSKRRESWSWPQRLKNDALYGLMRFGFGAARMLPIRGPLRLLGSVAPHIFRGAARRARRHLRDVASLTALFNDRMESAIRTVPEQWVWLHARWGRIAAR